ncbi:MAG TPA: apolipoprotein N-acyltransferase [Kiritimatiellae bacterium]|nr:apolipoprotein N-acyltransferase [Kiritimatiellia bacterium]
MLRSSPGITPDGMKLAAHRFLPRKLGRMYAAVLTGILLAMAYPPFSLPWTAWVALVPLAVTVLVRPHRSFATGWVAGFSYWFLTLTWLRHVTIAGWLGLSAYCAVYFGLFAWLVARLFDAADLSRWRAVAFVFLGATFWSGLEFLRGVLFTGFPWNYLGVSQYRNLPLIQTAALGGVCLVSWIIALVNMAGCTVLLRAKNRVGPWPDPAAVGVTLLAVVAAWLYGGRVLADGNLPAETLRVVLVQPNVAQHVKWDEEFVDDIYDKLDRLTRRAAASKPDLIVWPETALPDFLRFSRRSYSLVTSLVAQAGVRLLVGTMDADWDTKGSPAYYNSSLLIGLDGGIEDRYDKQHLVMFGEYVPFGRWLPFLRALTPLEESFTPGRDGSPILVSRAIPAGILICFEDTVPALALRAVRRGARLLINQTNDAWFDPSAGSWQHLANAVFRCVENRVPAIRCTNSGVTCVVDVWGRICKVLADSRMNPRVEGVLDVEVRVPCRLQATPYRHTGDLFGGVTAATTVLALGAVSVRVRRRGGYLGLRG